MNMRLIIWLFSIFFTGVSVAQSIDDIPYYEIPEYPETYTAGSVAARQVDGLGFRFYWASFNLTEKDLAYKPNDSVRTSGETIDHIYNLSKIIVNATLKQPNIRDDTKDMTYAETRKRTLENLKMAADILRRSDDISQYDIIFGERRFPFWNNINGPIADAIWHSGQLASFRRTTGNPINPNISQFNGTVKKE
jgi:hypothetical protein